MDSLFDRLRAFAVLHNLEFRTIFHEDTLSQVIYFNKLGYERTWNFNIEPALVAAIDSKLVENYIYDRIVSGVTENLLKKKRSK